MSQSPSDIDTAAVMDRLMQKLRRREITVPTSEQRVVRRQTDQSQSLVEVTEALLRQLGK